MAVPFALLFLALLGGYLLYSGWARLDPRFPIAAALGLLGVTAVAEASGASATANALAEFVFFLLAGGVLLLLVDYARGARRPGPSAHVAPVADPAAQPVDERDRSSDQALDRPEQ